MVEAGEEVNVVEAVGEEAAVEEATKANSMACGVGTVGRAVTADKAALGAAAGQEEQEERAVEQCSSVF